MKNSTIIGYVRNIFVKFAPGGIKAETAQIIFRPMAKSGTMRLFTLIRDELKKSSPKENFKTEALKILLNTCKL